MREYCNRLDGACSRAGNVFSLDEECTIFEAGTIPERRSLVSRHREENSQISFLELVQFARAEGAAHRACAKPKGKRLSLPREKPRPLMPEEAQSSSETSIAFPTQGGGSGQVLFLGGADTSSAGHSVLTADLPSTVETGTEAIEP